MSAPTPPLRGSHQKLSTQSRQVLPEVGRRFLAGHPEANQRPALLALSLSPSFFQQSHSLSSVLPPAPPPAPLTIQASFFSQQKTTSLDTQHLDDSAYCARCIRAIPTTHPPSGRHLLGRDREIFLLPSHDLPDAIAILFGGGTESSRLYTGALAGFARPRLLFRSFLCLSNKGCSSAPDSTHTPRRGQQGV